MRSHNQRRLESRLAIIGSLQTQLAEARARQDDIERQIASGSISVNTDVRRANARAMVEDLQSRLTAARRSAQQFADLTGGFPGGEAA